jgi:signal transduction histidine kinase
MTRGGESSDERLLELEGLVNHLQQSYEADKHRLARELHDEFGSILISVKMDIESVAARLADAPPELMTRLRRSQASLEQAVEIKRKMIEELRPSLLDNLGLGVALDWLVSESCRKGGLAHTLSFDDNLPSAGPIPINLFRIVEEALANIVKSASARNVAVELTLDGDNVSLIVEDDGVGIPAGAAESRLTHGIAGIRQRVKALGGDMSLKAAPEKGTVLEINVPFSGPR